LFGGRRPPGLSIDFDVLLCLLPAELVALLAGVANFELIDVLAFEIEIGVDGVNSYGSSLLIVLSVLSCRALVLYFADLVALVLCEPLERTCLHLGREFLSLFSWFPVVFFVWETLGL